MGGRFRVTCGTGAVLVLALLGRTSAGQEYRPGDEVVAIADAKLTVENSAVDNVWPGLVLKVGAVNGQWLWVNNGKPGWLDQRHVIPLDRAAVDRLTAMIRANSTDARLYSGRAAVWRSLDEFEIAITDYNEAIRLNPSSGHYNNRGLAWRIQGENDKALADFNEALRLTPESVAVYLNRGVVWAVKGDYDKALADFNEVLRLDPTFAVVYGNRGRLWRTKGEYDKAIADFNEALRLDPKLASAYRNRGGTWWVKGDYDKALADYNEALRVDPKGRNAAILGHLGARQAKDEAAAKRLLAAASQHDEAWPSPAIRFLRGEIDEPALLELAVDDDKRTEARCYLGIDRALAGRTDEAVAHFGWVKEHGDKTSIEYTIALTELQRLQGAAGE